MRATLMITAVIGQFVTDRSDGCVIGFWFYHEACKVLETVFVFVWCCSWTHLFKALEFFSAQ